MSLKSIAMIDYVVLPCRNVQNLRRFYRDVLGFPISYEREDWVKFQIGASALALRPLDGLFADRRVEGPAVQLAFRVDYADVDACHEQLKGHGVPIIEPPADQDWGHRTLFFSDPEGNVLEIFADLPSDRPIGGPS